MKIMYDTEFLETGSANPILFISIGMVREDGAEYYAVNGSISYGWQRVIRDDPWLGPNVWAHLPHATSDDHDEVIDDEHPDVKRVGLIGNEVSEFCAEGLAVGERAELWAYYAAYDHVVLAQLFGRMVDLPLHMPMYTHDIVQEADRQDVQLPGALGDEHHALADARWNVVAWKALGFDF